MPHKTTSPLPFHEVVSDSKIEPIELGGIDLEIDAIAAHRNILHKNYDEEAKKAGEATVEMMTLLATKLQEGSVKVADPFTEGNVFVKVPTDSGVYHVNPFSAARSQVNYVLGTVATVIEESSLKVADPFTDGAVFQKKEDLSHLKNTTVDIMVRAAEAIRIGALKTGDPFTEGAVFEASKKDIGVAKEAVSHALDAALDVLQSGSRATEGFVLPNPSLEDVLITVEDAKLKADTALDACAQALEMGLLKVDTQDTGRDAMFTLQT